MPTSNKHDCMRRGRDPHSGWQPAMGGSPPTQLTWHGHDQQQQQQQHLAHAHQYLQHHQPVHRSPGAPGHAGAAPRGAAGGAGASTAGARGSTLTGTGGGGGQRLAGGGGGGGGGWGAVGLRSRTSPAPDSRRPAAPSRVSRQLTATLAGAAKSAAAARQRDKWVALPDEGGPADDATAAAAAAAADAAAAAAASSEAAALLGEAQLAALQQGAFRDHYEAARAARQRGRITVYCVADSFDRKKLDELLRATFPSSAIKSYPDVFYVEYFAATEDVPGGDLFFFDYGVVACWGLDQPQEAAVIKSLASQAGIQLIADDEVEVDQFLFNYSSLEKSHIQNDMVTLHRKAAKDHQIKLAISYALAQSTKLSLHERRVTDMVVETKHLPESLAACGKVAMSPETIAKLIGKVFIQKAAVNLLSSVLDTPEYFWRGIPDTLQQLYEGICEYLELEERVEVLNARFAVLQEMLDMLRDHESHHHSARLEWIIIYLIIVEVVVGVLEVLSLFGLVGSES